MLTLIALSALVMQNPPAPPAPAEVRTRFTVMGEHGPAAMDKDGDGAVSREEFAAPMNDHFARMDANGDGRLSTEELSAGHHGPSGDEVRVLRAGPGGEHGAHRFEIRRPHADGPHAPGGRQEREIVIVGPGGHGMPHLMHGPGHGPEGDARIQIHHAREGHAEMDKDGDSRISEAEFTGPLREAFARMDVDRSGFIEEGERGQGHDVRVFTHRVETPDRED